MKLVMAFIFTIGVFICGKFFLSTPFPEWNGDYFLGIVLGIFIMTGFSIIND